MQRQRSERAGEVHDSSTLALEQKRDHRLRYRNQSEEIRLEDFADGVERDFARLENAIVNRLEKTRIEKPTTFIRESWEAHEADLRSREKDAKRANAAQAQADKERFAPIRKCSRSLLMQDFNPLPAEAQKYYRIIIVKKCVLIKQMFRNIYRCIGLHMSSD